MKYNDILKLEREKRNISMKQFAIQIGIRPDTYRKYERGEREPDIDTLIKIANQYSVSMDYLTGRYNIASPEQRI